MAVHLHPSDCECDMHGQFHPHGIYGEPTEQAMQLVRVTCEHCDVFQVKRWCRGCLDGVHESGRNWRCEGCQRRMDPLLKINHIVRLGDL